MPLGFITILVAEIWMSTPFMVIILEAGILSLPTEPFEAAEVDGASGWQKFRHLTLPMIMPFIYTAMAIRSLDLARVYDVVSIMTGGGPGNRTELIWTYVYRLAFTGHELRDGQRDVLRHRHHEFRVHLLPVPQRHQEPLGGRDMNGSITRAQLRSRQRTRPAIGSETPRSASSS